MENERNDEPKAQGGILEITPDDIAEFEERCRQINEDERRAAKGRRAARTVQ